MVNGLNGRSCPQPTAGVGLPSSGLSRLADRGLLILVPRSAHRTPHSVGESGQGVSHIELRKLVEVREGSSSAEC